MTRRHALIWETAVRANPLGFLFTGRAYIRNFHWQPDERLGAACGVARRRQGDEWQVPPMMCFHAVQAYELGDDIVAELCVYDDVAVFEDLQLDRVRNGVPLRGVPKLARYVLRRGSADARPETFGEAFELPQVHPDRIGQGRSRFAWGAAFDPASAPTFFDRTMRIDLVNDERRVWQRPNAVQLEPLFVPRPGSKTDDDGVLLVPTLADDDEATVIGVRRRAHDGLRSDAARAAGSAVRLPRGLDRLIGKAADAAAFTLLRRTGVPSDRNRSRRNCARSRGSGSAFWMRSRSLPASLMWRFFCTSSMMR